MKRLITIALVAMMSTLVFAQTTSPKINFTEKEHDFETILEADGPVTHIFKFINIGTEPLLLKNVKASCGCTTPKWTKEPVLPNAEGEIAVTYNPRNRPGAFRKTITVTSNSETANTYLTIKGKVTGRVKTTDEKYPFRLANLHLQKSTVSFYTLSNKQTKNGVINVLNNTDKDITLMPDEMPAFISVDAVVIKPKEEKAITITYDGSKRDAWGFVSDDLSFLVDGEKATTLIRLSATIVQDFSGMNTIDRTNSPIITPDTRKVEFGTVKRGEAVKSTVSIVNTGKSPLIIHAAKSTSSIVSCTVGSTEIAPGASTTIDIEIDTQRTRGRQYKTVNIITNDYKSPNLTITLSGTVE